MNLNALISGLLGDEQIRREATPVLGRLPEVSSSAEQLNPIEGPLESHTFIVEHDDVDVVQLRNEIEERIQQPVVVMMHEDKNRKLLVILDPDTGLAIEHDHDVIANIVQHHTPTETSVQAAIREIKQSTKSEYAIEAIVRYLERLNEEQQTQAKNAKEAFRLNLD
jgi:hypothetical protein